MKLFWTLVLVVSLILLAYNIYNIVMGVKNNSQWYFILLSSIGVLAGLNSTNSSIRNLF
jgi:uncharacterized membrane protein